MRLLHIEPEVAVEVVGVVAEAVVGEAPETIVTVVTGEIAILMTGRRDEKMTKLGDSRTIEAVGGEVAARTTETASVKTRRGIHFNLMYYWRNSNSSLVR